MSEFSTPCVWIFLCLNFHKSCVWILLCLNFHKPCVWILLCLNLYKPCVWILLCLNSNKPCVWILLFPNYNKPCVWILLCLYFNKPCVWILSASTPARTNGDVHYLLTTDPACYPFQPWAVVSKAFPTFEQLSKLLASHSTITNQNWPHHN